MKKGKWSAGQLKAIGALMAMVKVEREMNRVRKDLGIKDEYFVNEQTKQLRKNKKMWKYINDLIDKAEKELQI